MLSETSARALWITGLAFACLAGKPSAVHAFCRTTTVDVKSATCPEPCDTTGSPLYWDTPDIEYTLNSRGFPGMDKATESRIFAQSFAAWAAVKCDQAPLGFKFDEDSETSTELAVHHDRGTNKNVMAWLSVGEWAEEEHSTGAFALTSVYYNPNTGHIYGADIEFNGGMPRFGECPAAGCGGAGDITDLRNVATHEIGHVLGLAHSRISDATMSCEARPGDTDKRSLGTDDVDGICDAYPPGRSFVKDPSPSTSTVTHPACSAAPGRRAHSGALALLALGGLALVVRARRRVR